MPKVLLVYPSQLYAPSWGTKIGAKPHMLSLFSFLRYNKIKVDVLDLENEIGRPRNEDEVKEFLKRSSELIFKLDFDIVAISCWSSLNYLSSVSVAGICRAINHRSIIVTGGYHPSALPQDFTYDKSPFDFIIIGEGETALLEICKDGKKKNTAPNIIPGGQLTLKKVFATDWKHYKYTNTPPVEYIYLSRGCLYNCAFCMESSKGYKTWRSYSVPLAIAKIKEAINILNLKEIRISDACFGLNKIWRRKFLYELIKYKIDVMFWVLARAELFDKEDIDLLSKLNFNIEFGLESGSEEMLSIMEKTGNPKAYLKRYEDVITYLNKKEVSYRIGLIFNHPGETPTTYNRSIAFLKSVIRKQNKISGVLGGQDYAFFPGNQIYRNYNNYKERFGTVVRHRQWWKEQGDHWNLSRSIIPSREMLKHGKTKVHWQKAISDLNNQCIEKMTLWPRFFRKKRSEILRGGIKSYND